MLKICHDRVLPPQQAQPQPRVRAEGGRTRAIAIARKLWINGTRLSVRFMEGTEEQKALVKTQAAWWTAHANLTFAFDDSPQAQIRITFDPSDGAWSYVGTDCSGIARDQPTMNLGFLDGGTAAHEFGHAIGLAHEHQSPFGGIQWNEAAVIADLQGSPNFWTEEQIRQNVLKKYSVDQIRGTDFDRDSIMLYFFPDSWVKNGPGTKANEVLSNVDKAFIESEKAYPGRKSAPVPLAVGADPVAAEISKPGEEDLFQFVAAREGRHVIETQGATDVVVRLFGPNDATTVVAEDDDGGAGTNARIVTNLIPGTYTVQVRHFNPRRGRGSYRIAVTD
jgi:hypothetical protein